MRSRCLMAALAVACALVWLASCGGRTAVFDDNFQATDDAPAAGNTTGLNGEAVEQATVDINDLAALLETWKEPAATEWSEENRFLKGKAYEYDLPNRRISRPYPRYEMVYSPVEDPNGEAYAFYQFPLAGYDGPSEIHFGWDTPDPPQATAEKWIGLANMDELRWDWFMGTPKDPVLLDSLKPYLSENGTLRIIVLLFGEGDFLLEWIRVGGNLEPYLVVSSDPEEGPAGDVLINAFGSVDLDGEIAKCEFDLDNDGFFEVDNGNCKFIYQEIHEPGPHLKRVRITDDAGASVTDHLTVTINNWVEEPIATMCYDEYSVCSDNDGNVYAAYNYWDPQAADPGAWVTLATNESGEWSTHNLVFQNWFLQPDVDVDYMGRPVVSILHIDEEYNKTYRFFREDAGIWQEMLDWNLEAESGVSFLKCALDSSGYPHIAHGATGDLEFSGQFDYSYFDGTSWHTPLRNIISSRVQIELDADDKAHFMFFNLDLQSTFWCVPSGDGYYFRLEQEYGELGDFMLHPSGSPVYTCSEIDVYNLQQFGNNPCVNYCWDQIYYIDDYEQEDMHGIESAFDLDSAESPHICFKRNSYDVSEAITHDKLGYAIRDGYDWNVEWVSQGCGVAYHNLKMLLDAEDQPVIIAVKPMWEFYNQEFYQRWDSLVMIRPR